MLKKAVFYISVVIIILLCVYSIILMYQADTKYDVSIDSNEIQINKVEEIYTVKKGDVTQTITLRGTVAPFYEEERIEVFVENNLDKIEKFVKSGDILEENQVYAKCDEYEYKAESKLKCVSVDNKENGVLFVFIDYGKLYIDVNIPEKYAEDSLYNKNVSVNSKEMNFSGEISYIDAYCNSGTINSRISYKNKEILLRPGAECSVTVTLDQKKDVLRVPLHYIIYSEYDDIYRVLLSDGKKSMNIEVEVGIIGDEFVEIISGVSEDSCIALPTYEKSLKFYLSRGLEGLRD